MTIQEIKKRNQEIEARMAEISQIAERAINGEVVENLDQLNLEADSLKIERNKLSAEMVKINAELKDDANFRSITDPIKENNEERNMKTNNFTATKEYREQFMKYVQTGIKGDLLKRSDEFTTTADVKSVIVPVTITEQLFKKDPNAGALYDLVTKTNHPFGMNIPVVDTEFEIEWVAERSTSEKKKSTTATVTFTGFKGLIKFVQSFETSVMTLPEFEQAIVQKMLEGARKSFDKVIVAGTGVNQPKGILADGDYTKKSVVVTEADVAKYSTWVKAYAKVPQNKKTTGSWIMNDGDWTQYILGMVDDNNRPIAVERLGVDGMPRKFFLGRPVVTLENQGLPTFDSVTGNASASKTTAFALFADLSDYWLNLNKDMTMKDYVDEDTDDQIKKLIVLADGKMVDKTSIVAVCKGAAE